MNCRMIFTDIDGTLVNSRKEITPAVKSALKEASSNGIKITIASGRPFQGIKPYIKELGLDKTGGYVLAYNGGRIIDCLNNKVLYDISLSYNVIKKAYRLSKKYNLDLITYRGDNILTENINNKYLEIESRINNMPAIEVADLLKEIKDAPVKCLILGDSEILKRNEQEIKSELSKEAEVFKSEPFFLEIMPKGIDKASSIKNFIKNLNIKQEEIIAFGDGYNDISMVQFAGMGVAMKNGCDEILKKADFITDFTNDEDGIAEFLKKYNIIWKEILYEYNFCKWNEPLCQKW